MEGGVDCKRFDEFERRNAERGLYRGLSRYYPLGWWKKELWARPPLLKGKHGYDCTIYRRHFTYPNSS